MPIKVTAHTVNSLAGGKVCFRRVVKGARGNYLGRSGRFTCLHPNTPYAETFGDIEAAAAHAAKNGLEIVNLEQFEKVTA